jgi:LIVCS family branched-chain amino acid:cation transporter
VGAGEFPLARGLCFELMRISLGGIDTFFNTMVPLHSIGMGWISFAIAGFIIGLIWKGAVKSTAS